jgi:hypothetical protein
MEWPSGEPIPTPNVLALFSFCVRVILGMELWSTGGMKRSGSDTPKLSDLRELYRRLLQVEAKVTAVQDTLKSLSQQARGNAKNMGVLFEQYVIIADTLGEISEEVKKPPPPPPEARRKPRSSRSKLQ